MVRPSSSTRRPTDLHHLNPTATIVFGLCDGTSTIPDMSAEISEAFEVPADEVETQVRTLIRRFRKANLLTPSASGYVRVVSEHTDRAVTSSSTALSGSRGRVGCRAASSARVRRDVPLALLDALDRRPGVPDPARTAVQRRRAARIAGTTFWLFLPGLIVIHLLCNYLFGLYGQMWRYASVQEARRVVLSGATSFVLVLALDVDRRPWDPALAALRDRVRKRDGGHGIRCDPVPEPPLRVPSPHGRRRGARGCS